MKIARKIMAIVAAISMVFVGNIFSAGAEAAIPFDFSIKASKGTVVPGDSFYYELSPMTFDGVDGEKAIDHYFRFTTEKVDSALILNSIDLPKAVFTIDGKEYGCDYGLYDIEIAQNSATSFIIQPNDEKDHVTITREDIDWQAGGATPTMWFIYVRPVDENGNWLPLNGKYYEKFEMQGSVKINFSVAPNSTDRLFPTLVYPYFYVQQYAKFLKGPAIDKRQKNGYTYFATYDIAAETTNKYLAPGENTTIPYTITNTGPYPISRLQLDLATDFEITDTSWTELESGKYTKYIKDAAGKFIAINAGETYKFDLPVKQKEGTKSGDILNTKMYLFTGGTTNLQNHFSNDDFVVSEDYDVIYDANGASAGDVPLGETDIKVDTPITIADNTGKLVVDGKVFDGWNTKSDYSGKSFAPGDITAIKNIAQLADSASNGGLYSDNKVVLYAIWRDKDATTTESTSTSVTGSTESTSNTSTTQSATVSSPSTGEKVSQAIFPLILLGFAAFVVIFTRRKLIKSKMKK